MGGLSFIYDFNDETESWDGTLIWPSPNNIDVWFKAPHWVEPLVQRLDIQKAPGETFFLTLGQRAGASLVEKLLTVWTWRNDSLESVLEVRLDNWCGYQEWQLLEVTEEGDILVQAAPATGRCEAQDAVIYTWVNGEFVSSTP
jgi:hypothetical protein